MDNRQLFERAVERESLMMLDAVGIDAHKTRSQLMAYEIHQDSLRNYYGYNWITRLWCMKIRPTFFKARQLEAWRQVTESEQWLRGDFWADVRRQWETGQIRR